jgi:hydroxyacylglutathione hydrolase
MNEITVQAIPYLTDNYAWVIRIGLQALIVDPGEATPILQFIAAHGLNLRGILLTHKHWDHVNGVAGLLKQFDVPVFLSKKDAVPTVTDFINEEEEIRLDPFPPIQVLEIPGHTLGHVAYYVKDTVFCGDTLFSAGCGKLFEGTAKQMLGSLDKLAHLPLSTKVCCGHEYTLNNLRFAKAVESSNNDIEERMSEVKQLLAEQKPSLPSTIGLELKINPFLRCHETEVIENVKKYAGASAYNRVEVFANLREWKNHF